MSDPVLIIGAGVAGLSAAAALRARQVDVLLVEASDRIGGRALTTRIGGHPFDHGAQWLHHAERNPLVPLADPADLFDSDARRTRIVMVGDRRAEDAELAARAEAIALFDATTAAATADLALARVIDPVRAHPWIPTIEAWEAAHIAAADPDDFSVFDYVATALDGGNAGLRQGIGSFVTTTLGAMAGPVFLATPILSLDWRDGIRAETPRGTIRARACIVTCSTAALQRIRITPTPPVSPDGLPMGLLTKVVFRARSEDRLGLAADTSISPMLLPDQPYASCLAWPGGADHLMVFIGGPRAWDLARAGAKATTAFARARLRTWFGSAADKTLEEVLVTGWADDPWHLGAYAYARPGHAGDRAGFGTPFAEGRMIFAGEATAQGGLAGTVGGAWAEGQRAAEAVLTSLTR